MHHGAVALSLAAIAAATACAPAPGASAALARTGALAARGLQGATIELLTYNVWGKPGILGTDQARRMGQIGPAIRPYQVVALQETFTAHAELVSRLSGFPFQTWHRDKRWYDVTTSGLFTLSNFVQVEVDFAPFEQGATWDRFANKGVLFTRLQVPGVGPVDIYNTHYQAELEFGKIREHDNAVLAALVREHDAGHPTIFMGDFNMDPDTPEYRDLAGRLGVRDAWRELHPDEPGWTVHPDNTNLPDDNRKERLDYVFALPRAKWDVRFERAAVVMDRPAEGGHMSDHYGVAVTARITPRD